jgi:hypothetical protein
MFESNTNIEIIGYITLVQLWWIAIWGIAFILIEYLSNKSKVKELSIYILLLFFVFITIVFQPNLLNHA